MPQKILLTIFAIVITFSFTFSFGLGKVLAQVKNSEKASDSAILSQVNQEEVNPSDGARFLVKRFKEKINLLILTPFPSRKIDFYTKLIDVRLAELKYIIDKKDPDKIETSSIRYATTVGWLTEMLDANKGSDFQKKAAKDLMVKHLEVVNKLKGAYNDTTAEWRFVENDANFLKTYISQLSD